MPFRVAGERIYKGQVVKLDSTQDVVLLFDGASDDASLLHGVALQDAQPGASLEVLTEMGAEVALYFDGAGSELAPGDPITASPTVPGAVSADGTVTIGLARSTIEAAAAAGTVVEAQWKGSAGAGGGASSGLGWFNVRDYGATGDGTTDDGPAVQAAFDAAKAVGGTVYFQAIPGLVEGMGYRIETPVALEFVQGEAIGFRVFSDGDSAPIICATGTGNDVFNVTVSGVEWSTFSFEGLTFITSHMSSDGAVKDCRRALSLTGTSNEQFRVYRCKGVGVSVDDYLFHFIGSAFYVEQMHNSGNYCDSAGAPVYAFIHFDQCNDVSLVGVSSFGEYKWFTEGNSVSGLGSTNALVKVTPNRNASWGPTTIRLRDIFSSSRDGNIVYCYQPTGVLRAASLDMRNSIIERGAVGGLLLDSVQHITIADCTWRAGSAALLLDAYRFGSAHIERVTTPTGQTVPNVRDGDGSGTIEIVDTIIGTATEFTAGSITQRRGVVGGESLGATIASAATIAPTRKVHKVSGAVTVNIITPPFVDFRGTITLLPTGAWAWNDYLSSGGNIQVGGTAVVGKALHLTYDGTNWWPSYV